MRWWEGLQPTDAVRALAGLWSSGVGVKPDEVTGPVRMGVAGVDIVISDVVLV